MIQSSQLKILSKIQNLNQQIRQEFNLLKHKGEIVTRSEMTDHLASIDKTANILNQSWQLIQSQDVIDENMRTDIIDLFVVLADLKKDLLVNIKYTNN